MMGSYSSSIFGRIDTVQQTIRKARNHTRAFWVALTIIFDTTWLVYTIHVASHGATYSQFVVFVILTLTCMFLYDLNRSNHSE